MKIALYYPFLNPEHARQIGEADISPRVMQCIADGMNTVAFVLLPNRSVLDLPLAFKTTERIHRITAKMVRIYVDGQFSHSKAVLYEQEDREKVLYMVGEWVSR